MSTWAYMLARTQKSKETSIIGGRVDVVKPKIPSNTHNQVPRHVEEGTVSEESEELHVLVVRELEVGYCTAKWRIQATKLDAES